MVSLLLRNLLKKGIFPEKGDEFFIETPGDNNGIRVSIIYFELAFNMNGDVCGFDTDITAHC